MKAAEHSEGSAVPYDFFFLISGFGFCCGNFFLNSVIRSSKFFFDLYDNFSFGLQLLALIKVFNNPG